MGRRPVLLRAAGAMIALPSLESFAAPLAKAAGPATGAKKPCFHRRLPWLAPECLYYPKEVGKGYTLPHHPITPGRSSG